MNQLIHGGASPGNGSEAIKIDTELMMQLNVGMGKGYPDSAIRLKTGDSEAEI